MIVRKLRLDRGWSQEQLAEITDLSVRTIQRVERGQKASLETVKSLAAAFEVDFNELSKELLMQENIMNNEAEINNQAEEQQNAKVEITADEAKAYEYARDIRGFYSHIIKYVVVIAILAFIDLVLTSPEKTWFYWPALGWGIGVIAHGMSVFEIMNFFGPKWERRQAKKYLKRKSG